MSATSRSISSSLAQQLVVPRAALRSSSPLARASSSTWARSTASGLRSSCEASETKSRWRAKALSSRSSMWSKASASTPTSSVGRRARCGGTGPPRRPLRRRRPSAATVARSAFASQTPTPSRAAGPASPTSENVSQQARLGLVDRRAGDRPPARCRPARPLATIGSRQDAQLAGLARRGVVVRPLGGDDRAGPAPPLVAVVLRLASSSLEDPRLVASRARRPRTGSDRCATPGGSAGRR